MPIDSLGFVYLFLPASMAAYYLTSNRYKNFVLLVVSRVFYGMLFPTMLPMALGSLLFDYLVVQLLALWEGNPAWRSLAAGASVVKNMGMLLALGMLARPQALMAPAGLSVINLTSMGYVLDVYDHEAPADSSFVRYGILCLFFGKVFVGPLVTYNQLAPQLKKIRPSLSGIASGVVAFTIGLGKKVILADSVTALYESLRATPLYEMTSMAAWVMVLAFAFALYFTLSAYSDMARGLGKIFGLDLPQNFYYPYQARTVTEFFGRFNMTVSEYWKRYIRLGRPDGSHARLTAAFEALFVTALWGVWFGFSPNCLAFGLLIGALVLVERHLTGKLLRAIPPVFSRMITFLVVILSLVFLLGGEWSQIAAYLRMMFGLGSRPATDETFLYLISSNYLVLLGCLFLSTSSADMLGRWIKKNYPQLDDGLTVVFNIGLLVITTALLL